MENSNWEEIGLVGVDAASCAFGDAVAFGRSDRLDAKLGRGGPHLNDGVVQGMPLVLCITGGDIDMPVEVRRTPTGDVVAARMAFVDDLDDLDGSWSPLGTIEITSGVCVACDPFCEQGSGLYRFEFAVPPGLWSAERFEYENDVLALKITKQPD